MHSWVSLQVSEIFFFKWLHLLYIMLLSRQRAGLTIKNNLGFSVSLKDTLACGQEEVDQWTTMSHSHPSVRTTENTQTTFIQFI